MVIVEVSRHKVFDGFQLVYMHDSTTLECQMRFGVYLPPQYETQKLPVVYWLSGLTCTEANFIEKSGAQRYAAEYGVILVNPDTSPRKLKFPEATARNDVGEGAGFYVDAVQEPWVHNFKMYTYITSELVNVVGKYFKALEGQQSIMGHSMGGHGALICALKNPHLYKSISVFAPICNPSECNWGKRAFTSFFGENNSEAQWAQWDATELVKQYEGPNLEIVLDQGTDDPFLKEEQLLPDNLIKAAKNSKISIVPWTREGYDHGYFYISTFIGEHIRYHAKYLK